MDIDNEACINRHYANKTEESPLDLLIRLLEADLKQHFTCNSCKNVWEQDCLSSGDMLVHNKSRIAHEEPILLECVECKMALTSRDDVKQQVMIHESNPTLKYQFECEQCKHKFKYRRNLMQHMLTHVSDPRLKRPFKCTRCDKRFTRNSSLRAHIMLTHESDFSLKQPFKCEECEKRFSKKVYLKRHTLTHQSDPTLKHTFSCK